MINPLVKKHFLKYGLPASVLQSINGIISTSITDESTEDEVIEICKTYDAFAKSFQSEVDAKVAKARKESSKSKSQDDDDDEEEEEVEKPKSKSKPSKLEQMLATVLEKVDKLEKEKVSTSYQEKATTKLKDLKLTDSEIKALLHGRTFTTDEELDEFVEVQAQLFEEVSRERVALNLGNGNRPANGGGETSLESFKADLEAFNKAN